jgi:TrpR-related protein YerC/YecD
MLKNKPTEQTSASIISLDQKALYKAFMSIKSEEDLHYFLLDLCTPAEIKSMVERWVVVRHLWKKIISYRVIHEITRVSIATITRVARFLNHEKYGGYRRVLEGMEKEHND